MAITQDQILTFIGGGVVVFILEQIIHHFKREKKVLGYSVDSRVLVEKSHPDLKILFKDIDVSKVLSHRVVLTNIGNTCLRDFVAYFQGAGGTFYFADISAKPGICCEKFDSPQCFALRVDMLNPGDEVKVELTILNAEDTTLTVDGRAENLRTKKIAAPLVTPEMIDAALSHTSGFTWLAAKIVSLLVR